LKGEGRASETHTFFIDPTNVESVLNDKKKRKIINRVS